MADFSFNVDTTQMAQSIDTVNRHVNSVTDAVIIMQSAVVDAQRQASQNICNNVDQGFYILMRSQMSQKMAECSSIVSSKIMLMSKFRDDINRIQYTMQNDYNRIAARYLKVFNSLDDALKKRITQLDKRTVELGELKEKLANQLCNETAKIIISDEDIQNTTNEAVIAVTKQRTKKSLKVLADNVINTTIYNDSVDSILKPEVVDNSTLNYIPVLVTESDSMFVEGTSISNTYIPQDDVISSKKDKIINQVDTVYNEFPWKDADENEVSNLRNLFVSKCSENNVDERVAKEMLRLFDESHWQTLDKKGE